MITKDQISALYEVLAPPWIPCETACSSNHECKERPPILIGDVQEKMWGNEGEKISFDEVHKNIKKLLYLWRPCGGLDCSLQEIESWVCENHDYGNLPCTCKEGKRLTPKAEALFLFLIHIFIPNEK